MVQERISRHRAFQTSTSWNPLKSRSYRTQTPRQSQKNNFSLTTRTSRRSDWIEQEMNKVSFESKEPTGAEIKSSAETQFETDRQWLGGEQIYASNPAMQRGRKPGGPNPNRCRNLLHDIIAYLIGGALQWTSNGVDGKNVKRGLPERYNDLRVDRLNLYENYRDGGPNTYQGHKDFYNEQRDRLQKLIDQWKKENCDDWDGGDPEVKQNMPRIIAEAEKWADKKPPDKPDRYLNQQPGFSLPEFEMPDLGWLVGLLDILRQLLIDPLFRQS
jgi:hypothetical protein